MNLTPSDEICRHQPSESREPKDGSLHEHSRLAKAMIFHPDYANGYQVKPPTHRYFPKEQPFPEPDSDMIAQINYEGALDDLQVGENRNAPPQELKRLRERALLCHKVVEGES